jgi:hypothetical protein
MAEAPRPADLGDGEAGLDFICDARGANDPLSNATPFYRCVGQPTPGGLRQT